MSDIPSVGVGVAPGGVAPVGVAPVGVAGVGVGVGVAGVGVAGVADVGLGQDVTGHVGHSVVVAEQVTSGHSG